MLAGFVSKNHPQQTSRRGALDAVDDRGTPPDVFGALDARHGPFTLDVAAAPHNAKVVRYLTAQEDGLASSWAGERVWCNPPFSNLGEWVAKAWSEHENTLGIVMLLPANRTDQRWWQTLVETRRDRAGSALRVEFMPGRLRFVLPGASAHDSKGRPPFGCCLLIWADPQSQSSGL